jgi:ParB family chromosome partitioning protein
MSGRDNSVKGLGRGLASLLGDTSQGAQQTVQSLAWTLLEPGPFQPRMGFESGPLEELAASIRARGVVQPLLVRPHPTVGHRYQIIAGERRWRAAQMAELSQVPVLIRMMTDQDALAVALVENLQREDLNAVEEAEGYRHLIEDYGMTQDALARDVGKSRSHVANTLRLLHLPPSVLAEVRNGALSAGHARALLNHPAPERAAQQIVSGNLNVRQAEALAQKARSPKEGKQPRTVDPDAKALARELTDKLGLAVDIKMNGTKGSITIHCQDLEQFDALLALLNRG